MTSPAVLQRNRSNAIYVDLLKKILSGHYGAGERLPAERELALKYDTNRNTLREALRRLEQAKLVTVRHGQGATVTDFREHGTIELIGDFIRHTPQHEERISAFVDLLMARRQLIEMAVRMAAVRAGTADLEAIDNLVAQQIDAFEREDRAVLSTGDVTLITALVNASHSLTVRWIANTLLKVYEVFLEPAKALWILEPTFPNYLRTLRQAIADGNATEAANVTGRYYQRVDTALIRMLQSSSTQESPLAGGSE